MAQNTSPATPTTAPVTFNVCLPVIALVNAGDAAAAEKRLRIALRHAGFEVYDGREATVFESDVAVSVDDLADLPRYSRTR